MFVMYNLGNLTRSK